MEDVGEPFPSPMVYLQNVTQSRNTSVVLMLAGVGGQIYIAHVGVVSITI